MQIRISSLSRQSPIAPSNAGKPKDLGEDTASQTVSQSSPALHNNLVIDTNTITVNSPTLNKSELKRLVDALLESASKQEEDGGGDLELKLADDAVVAQVKQYLQQESDSHNPATEQDGQTAHPHASPEFLYGPVIIEALEQV